ncbi:hypothetical protein V5O48_016896 [Marasmius crinis-equi]|uniref:carbonic anhydrase n=1 Tax=Marasmius crinis-equi TaxID=585013 RepID=A0ABR3EQH7_9AGAR
MFSKSTFLSLSALAASASASCLYGTSAFERRAGAAKYTYGGENGPLTWGLIDSANSACLNSTRQSPIAIDSTVPFADSKPVVNVPTVEGAPIHNAGTVSVTYMVNGTTTFNGNNYNLVQTHFHTPSEHRLFEEYSPLEMHMVHQGADGSYVVLGVLFELSETGENTPLLSSVLPENSNNSTTGRLDFAPVAEAFQKESAFQYTGSLTAPPCTEGITFVILSKTMPMDVHTFNSFKKMLKFNSRYVQNALGSPNILELVANHVCGNKEEESRLLKLNL